MTIQSPTSGTGSSSTALTAARPSFAIAEPPSAREPDWSREHCDRWWQPSRRLLGALRDYSRAREQGGVTGFVRSKLATLRHGFWSVVTGADIPLNTFGIGGGLVLPHPQGVVIHPEVQIGPNCLLFQQVTLGTGARPGTPKLGGHVDVGAGAKILGGVVVGDHAVIGANAVVVSDVPPYGLAVGVPAVVKQRGRSARGLRPTSPADAAPPSSSPRAA